MEIPAVPTIFAKFPTAVIGPGEKIVLPKNSAKPDYEGEFAFVIGRRGRHVPAAAWKDYVFGYTILNDVSARDVQMATSQWMMGKTFDTFAPFGPALVTADEIADPHALDISTSIGGDTLQHSNTRNLIFQDSAVDTNTFRVCLRWSPAISSRPGLRRAWVFQKRRRGGSSRAMKWWCAWKVWESCAIPWSRKRTDLTADSSVKRSLNRERRRAPPRPVVAPDSLKTALAAQSGNRFRRAAF